MKKFLSALLIAAMLIGIAPIGGIDLAPKASAKDIDSYSVGDTIIYGSYPQSRVTDSNLIAAIESAGGSVPWVDYNYYAGSENLSDGNMKPVADMMLYKDITCGGNKYRAVKINQYRPYRTSATSYTYQEINGYYTGSTYYFKYEPLTWQVLDPSEGYVMCNQIIDSQTYQNFIYYKSTNKEYYNSKDGTAYASDWATSSIRQWLNDDFYNTAFTAEEKSQIGTSHLENKSIYSSTYDSADSYDKIFLLSYDEVTNSAYGFNTNTARQMKGTDYAKCQGLWVYNNEGSSYNGNSLWWLRSPDSSIYATQVIYSGCADRYYYRYSHVDNTHWGVLPAFKFNSKATICDAHDYRFAVIAPTCTQPGYTIHTCTKCNYSYADEYKNALGHDFEEWQITVAPTTISDGEKTRCCKICNAFETESLGRLKSITVKLNNIETNYKKSGQLEPEIVNPDNVGYKVEYESSNPQCVTVDADGNYSAVKRGSAEITCTVTDEFGNTVQDTCNINVSLTPWQWIIVILLFGWIWY